MAPLQARQMALGKVTHGPGMSDESAPVKTGSYFTPWDWRQEVTAIVKSQSGGAVNSGIGIGSAFSQTQLRGFPGCVAAIVKSQVGGSADGW